jgi:hypothetical protein
MMVKKIKKTMNENVMEEEEEEEEKKKKKKKKKKICRSNSTNFFPQVSCPSL